MLAILFEAPSNRNSRVNPSVCWLGGGGLRGMEIVNKNFVNKLAFPNLGPLWYILVSPQWPITPR